MDKAAHLHPDIKPACEGAERIGHDSPPYRGGGMQRTDATEAKRCGSGQWPNGGHGGLQDVCRECPV